MNTSFYEDLDTNFTRACDLATKELSHGEIITLLKDGNIPEKQIAALQLKILESQEEANILIDNLTGCDGKIREAVALKINNLLLDKTMHKYFISNPNIFADATIDINGNICRSIIDSVEILKDYSEFSSKYIKRILNFIKEAFIELDNFIFRDKKYVINKQLFKLYWCLEAIKLFTYEINPQTLYEILERASKEKEYTIREKVAQILLQLNDVQFDDLKNELATDENYYVREVLKNNN